MQALIDNTELTRQLRLIPTQAPSANRVATETLAEVFVERLLLISPEDTGRYKRSWIMAANQAGLTRRPLPVIKQSVRRKTMLTALQKQVEIAARDWDRWDRFEKHYRSQGRTGEPYLRTIKSRKRKAEKRVVKAQETLNEALANDGFLLFDRGGLLYGDNIRRLKNSDLNKFSSIRTQIYGGVGRTFTIGGQMFIELISREPHARIVERVERFGHPVRSSLASVRSFGMRRASQKYIDKLANGGVTMARKSA